MKLYFSPLACSLASRIASYEANARVSFEEVDPKTKLTSSGRDFLQLHPLGLVPVLELASGAVLSENAAVLQYLARTHPEAQLAPTDALGSARLQQWLCFIGTELHKGLFMPLLSKKTGTEAKQYALSHAESRLSWVARQLRGRQFLLERFSVADAYLLTILNWTIATPVDLSPWPELLEYQARLRGRPSVARAFDEESALYRQQQSRHAQQAGAASRTTGEVIERFNAAFLQHQPELLLDLIDDDCVLESSTPAPVGARHVGRAACLEQWRGIAQNQAARFELEQVEINGERAQIAWRYFWGPTHADSVRGLNLLRVRNGRIIEGRGYVKGS